MLTLQALMYNARHSQTDGNHLKWCHRCPDTLSTARHNAKPDHIIQLNCSKVHTHVSCKTTRTQESSNHRGTKMFLLSDELWLITNNSKKIANRVSQYHYEIYPTQVTKRSRCSRETQLPLRKKNSLKNFGANLCKVGKVGNQQHFYMNKL